jgi:hypothetical protein
VVQVAVVVVETQLQAVQEHLDKDLQVEQHDPVMFLAKVALVEAEVQVKLVLMALMQVVVELLVMVATDLPTYYALAQTKLVQVVGAVVQVLLEAEELLEQGVLEEEEMEV